MAFGAGERENKVFEEIGSRSRVWGRQTDVACKCWFTSRGEAMPLSVKLPDESGGYMVIRDVRVDSSDKKYYCGILSVEYICRMTVCGLQFPARLIFYPEECRWVMETEAAS